MRHFMMDVWIWTEDKHSKPLKTIRFEQDHFPTEKECWHWFTKDEDVEVYMKSGICVKFNKQKGGSSLIAKVAFNFY